VNHEVLDTTEDLLIGISRVLGAEAVDARVAGREREHALLTFLQASVLDTLEAMTGSDA
jgi:hypothetical protein